MINCTFLPVFYQHHMCLKQCKPLPVFENYKQIENNWLNFYGLGLFETYHFIYSECNGQEHLEDWLIQLKGPEQIQQSAIAFNNWLYKQSSEVDSVPAQEILTAEQRQFWQQHGYIKVSGLVEDHLCDAVVAHICKTLAADLSRPETWYPDNPAWHGLMLQEYQHPGIQAIRTVPAIHQLFAELYGTRQLIPRTEKVSFNPPETDFWKFRHASLHWDIDLSKGEYFDIQGLIYLNDVPENRGPLQVVPGFQHRFEDWITTWPDLHDAHQAMRESVTAVPVPGNKGDIVLWQQTLPHAASVNHSQLPRFVQYISFSKL